MRREEKKEKRRNEKEESNIRQSLMVGRRETAYGLGRRRGVIQSRFRPMNFI